MGEGCPTASHRRTWAVPSSTVPRRLAVARLLLPQGQAPAGTSSKGRLEVSLQHPDGRGIQRWGWKRRREKKEGRTRKRKVSEIPTEDQDC